MLKIIYVVTTTILILYGVTFSSMYISDLADFEVKKLQVLREKNLLLLSNKLDSEITGAKITLNNIKKYFGLYSSAPEDFQLDYVKTLMSNSMLLNKNQYNCYFALEPKMANKLVGKDTYVMAVTKDITRLGTESYGRESDVIVKFFDDPIYQYSEDEIWYHTAKKSEGFEITEVFFDTTYMKVWLFTVALGIYEDNKFQGMVGLDILADSFFESIENNDLKQTGGLILVNTRTGKIITKILSNSSYKPLQVIERNKVVAPEEFLRSANSEITYTGMDGLEYLLDSSRLNNFPWALVSYQDRAKLYKDIHKKITVIVVISFLLISFSVVILSLLMKKLKTLFYSLQSAKTGAEEANKAKSDFLTRMSHEIRTPLNAVTGLTNIVLKSELTPEQRDYLSKVRLASNNLLQVINDILDFSKVEAGRLELEQHPFDLDQLLKQMADLFSNRMAQKDLELVFTVAPQVERQLVGDSSRLIQILTNLIENAFKFTETGKIVIGVQPTDQIDQLEEKTALLFWVSDTGAGISNDVLPTLFEPFTQADSYLTRKHEGTGLGLAICKRLVELMGGRIWVESTPGQGSTFSFSLLFDNLTLPKIAIEDRNQETVVHSTRQLAGKRVLVVEDTRLNRDVTVALLEEKGCVVQTAENGRKAVNRVTKSPRGYYDAVLMDIQMPVMDGFEATKNIRVFERQQATTGEQPSLTTPIIALTAHALKGEKEKCFAAGMDDYLSKPLDEEDLHRVLLKWL